MAGAIRHAADGIGCGERPRREILSVDKRNHCF
ncbi:hypothetical protein M529_06590 [Sphingobium ummariense RL-3]|uniref:Uncharacterized protein n=1 Tax=Sphingobium ummariense RL-3 TaxID=1346791 RepID=T0J825_9SPHN|nr:hypothetical protein M529_06590 [Sphingobium ummariense RL-3]